MAVVATMVKSDDILVSARRPGPSFDKFGLGKASNLFFLQFCKLYWSDNDAAFRFPFCLYFEAYFVTLQAIILPPGTMVGAAMAGAIRVDASVASLASDKPRASPATDARPKGSLYGIHGLLMSCVVRRSS